MRAVTTSIGGLGNFFLRIEFGGVKSIGEENIVLWARRTREYNAGIVFCFLRL